MVDFCLFMLALLEPCHYNIIIQLLRKCLINCFNEDDSDKNPVIERFSQWDLPVRRSDTAGKRSGGKVPGSRSTLREVIRSLVEDGLLERRQGSGTYLKRLSRDCNPLIGVMVAHIEGIETIFARLVQNLERELAGHGYSIVLGSHNDDSVKAQQQIERFAKLKVAGIVIVPIQLPRAEDSNLSLMRMLGMDEIPFVLADSQVSARTNSWFSCVSVNNFQGMRQLVKYLYSLGHRRISHIKGLPGVYSSEVRYDGYCEAMRECGLPVLPEYIKEIKIGPVQYQGQSEIRELLKLSEPPTAITCVHDLVAGNVINELCRLGLKCRQTSRLPVLIIFLSRE